MKYLARAQVRDLDRRAIEEYGVPGIVLMENAGRGAAEVLLRLNPERQPVLIFCGKGNNGGDGYVIARHLDVAGYSVVASPGAPGGLPADADINYQIARRAGLVAELTLNDVVAKQQCWIVDALFGTGLTGPLREPFDRVVELINSSGANVLSVDIPSGLDCDTGKPLGPTVRADHTVTFVAPKAGFSAPEAREWLGEVHVVGIGAPRSLLKQYGLCQA